MTLDIPWPVISTNIPPSPLPPYRYALRTHTGHSMGGEHQGPTNVAYAYCHGFLSGPASVKGQALRKTMLEAGVDMSLLNLNGGDGSDAGAMTISGALKAVRQFHLDRKSTLADPGLKLRLVGSSLGGFIVARCGKSA